MLTPLKILLTLPWPNGGAQLKLLEFLVYSGADLNNARYDSTLLSFVISS